VKVVRKCENLLVIMPNRKTPDGVQRDIVHPINSDFRRKFDKQIVTYHNNVMPK
ncbi:MAG: septation protein SpoVG family protein, partial [Clostridia bacterium]|nr:septation protein SpoVG family protein [Clostridia bacterium]